jgi:hypothetical protein
MKVKKLPTTQKEQSLFLPAIPFDDFLAPRLHKGEMVQTHYVFSASRPLAVSFQVNLTGEEESSKAHFEVARNELSVANNEFPYGIPEERWWEYCLAPHSYLALGEGKCQIGLNMFNRFLHLDFNEKSFFWVDPEVGSELLSTTNWFDRERGEVWFASWPVDGTVRRLADPRADVPVTIWKLPICSGKIEQVWQGDLGDSLHQLCVDPTGRFLILTELGLRLDNNLYADSSYNAPVGCKKALVHGSVPSKILVLHLKTGREWRLSTMTAGHVEFDLDDPCVCYLSSHNIGLVGVKVGIFGPGIVYKYRLKENGPELLGKFTHGRFHRITTHILLRHRGKTLIAVSGYPGLVFLIDAATMQLHKIIEMNFFEKVDTTLPPHICGQDSYGICASNDGETLFIAGTGFVRIAHIAEGRIIDTQTIDDYGADCCFTGHLGNSLFTKRNNT